MMKLLFLIILVFSINQYVFSQTKIITNSDNQLIGIVTEETDMKLKLKTLAGELVELTKASIKSREILISEIKTKSGLMMKGNLTDLRESELEFLSTDSFKVTILYGNIGTFTNPDLEVTRFMNNMIAVHSQRAAQSEELENSVLVNKKARYTKYGVALGHPGLINLVYGYNNRSICIQASGGAGPNAYGFQFGPGVNLYSSQHIEHNILLVFGIMGGKISSSEYFGVLWDFNASGFHFQAGVGYNASSRAGLLLQIGYAYRIGK